MYLKVLLTVILALFQYHPFHVSVCEVKYDEDSKAIQIMQKIFLDDLEEGLFRNKDDRFDITDLAHKQEFDVLIKQYYTKKVAVTVNDKPASMVFLGYEFEEDALWAYAEVEKVRKLKSISITNEILFETFDDQSNIVHIENKGETRSFRLTQGDNVAQVNYQ